MNCNMALGNSYKIQSRMTEINKFIFWDKEFRHHCIMNSGESSKVIIQRIL